MASRAVQQVGSLLTRSWHGAAGDGLQTQGGVRRSSRGHQRPLEYWRNEKKVYSVRDHNSASPPLPGRCHPCSGHLLLHGLGLAAMCHITVKRTAATTKDDDGLPIEDSRLRLNLRRRPADNGPLRGADTVADVAGAQQARRRKTPGGKG